MGTMMGSLVIYPLNPLKSLSGRGERFELREDEAQAEPKSRATPQTSKGNETASGSRFNPKTTRKNPTSPGKAGTVPACQR
jgi:hypothetical protein